MAGRTSDPRALLVYGSIMMYGALMRTTIDIPDDLHRAASSLAHDRRQSLSRTLGELIRQGLSPSGGVAVGVARDPDTGFPVVHLGRPITTEMVRSAADED